jgi:hypothetical protein
MFGVEEKMDVVGHEAIVITAEGGGFGEELMKESAVRLIVWRSMEDGLAVISSCQDVVGGLRG